MAIKADLDNDTLAGLTKRIKLIDNNAQVVDEKTTVAISNTLTGIQNAFNNILTYSKNMNRIQKAKLEDTALNNKESILEAPKASPVSAATAASADNEKLVSLIPDLIKVIKKLDKDIDKLELSGGNGGPGIDIDLPSSKSKGRGRGKLGKLGRFAKGAAIAAATGYAIDAGFGMFGVGKGIDQDALDKQDDANWDRMSLFNKAESSVARGIEFAGDMFFLDNLSAEAKASRIKSETAYLDEKDKEKNPRAETAAKRTQIQQDKMVNTAVKAAGTVAMPVRKPEPTQAVSKEGNGWTNKVSAFIGDTYRTVTSFMGGFLAKISALAGQVGDFFSNGAQNLAGYFGFGGGPGYSQLSTQGAKGEWVRDTSFVNGVNALAQKYDIDPADLLGLMQSESGINPQAVNPGGGATGLIQFMPDTARAMGTSSEALRKMSRTQQLAYVDKFFAMNRLPKGATAGQLYATTYLPAYNNKPPNFVVARRGGANDAGANPSGSWYKQNAGLDVNGDGAITIADLSQQVSKKRQEIGLGPSKAGGGFRALGNLAAGAYSGLVSAVTGGVPPGQPIPLARVRSRSGASATVAAPYARNFQGFINDLESTGYRIKVLGGHSDRANVNDPRYKSFHAAAAAIDINPDQNPNGRARITDMPVGLTNQFARKWGLGWGLNFRGVSDAMHFSIAKFEGGSVEIPRVINTGQATVYIQPGEAAGPKAAATGQSGSGTVSPVKPQGAGPGQLPARAQEVAIGKKTTQPRGGTTRAGTPGQRAGAVGGSNKQTPAPAKKSTMEQFLSYFGAH